MDEPWKYATWNKTGTSLVVQWLRLQVPNAGSMGLIPRQEARSHMLQLKIPHAATETQYSQMNKLIFF